MENTNLQKTEIKARKAGVKSYLALIFLILSFLISNALVSGAQAPGEDESRAFAFFFLTCVFIPATIIFSILFILSRFSPKTKIITFILVLPFVLRIIFLFYSPIGVVEFLTKGTEETAISTRQAKKCLEINAFPNFFWESIFSDKTNSEISNLQTKCVSKIAVLEKDETICSSIFKKVRSLQWGLVETPEAEYCYLEVAKAKKDFSICEKLEEKRGDCYQDVFLVSEQYKDILAECRKFLPEYNVKRMEINECIKNAAIETKNLELCKGVTWYGMDTECIREIQIVTNDVLASCKDALTIEEKKECIKNIAIEKDAIDLCNLISYEYFDSQREACYKEIIFRGRRNIISSCEEVTEGWSLRVCEAEVAVNRNDISICNNIGNYTPAYWCATGIALKKKDPQICTKIYTLSERTDCFINLAVITNNLELCKKLEYQNQRETCIRKVSGDSQ